MKSQIVKKNNFTSIFIALSIVLAGIVITFFSFPYAKGLGSILILGGIIALSMSKKTLLHQDSICIEDTFQMVYFMLKDHCGKSFHGFCNHLTFVYIKVSYRD